MEIEYSYIIGLEYSVFIEYKYQGPFVDIVRRSRQIVPYARVALCSSIHPRLLSIHHQNVRRP